MVTLKLLLGSYSSDSRSYCRSVLERCETKANMRAAVGRGGERDEIETCPAKGCVILQHVVQPFQRRSRPSGPGNMMHQPLCNRNLQENGSQEPARVQPHSWSRLCLFESCVTPLNVSSNSAFQPRSPAGHSFFSFGRVE